jgi:succinyl-diaminopimelate desuccinylase
VRCAASSLPAAERITVDEDWDPALVGGDICSNYGGLARVRAEGVAGHAAMPAGSVNAIDVLARYLLENGLCDADEQEWLEFTRRITSVTDGTALGLDCEDADFGPATCVGGMATTVGDRFAQTIDVRFPTTTNLAELHAKVDALAGQIGASVETINEVEPLLVLPTSPEIGALRSAYEQVTGREAKLFTMGGGTYAHHFPVGVSFGAMDEDRFPPIPGVGGMHAADEGVQEECLRQALLIYIVALGNLFSLEWQ